MAVSALAAYGMASAGVNLFSGIMGKRSSDKMAKQQEKLGKLQASMIEDETEETLRRMDRENEQVLSTGEASVAASGFAKGSSQDVYMSSMATEMRTQRRWTEESGKKRADLARKSASYSADALRSQGKHQFAAGIGGAFQGMATAGAN